MAGQRNARASARAADPAAGVIPSNASPDPRGTPVIRVARGAVVVVNQSPRATAITTAAASALQEPGGERFRGGCGLGRGAGRRARAARTHSGGTASPARGRAPEENDSGSARTALREVRLEPVARGRGERPLEIGRRHHLIRVISHARSPLIPATAKNPRRLEVGARDAVALQPSLRRSTPSRAQLLRLALRHREHFRDVVRPSPSRLAQDDGQALPRRHLLHRSWKARSPRASGAAARDSPRKATSGTTALRSEGASPAASDGSRGGAFRRGA